MEQCSSEVSLHWRTMDLPPVHQIRATGDYHNGKLKTLAVGFHPVPLPPRKIGRISSLAIFGLQVLQSNALSRKIFQRKHLPLLTNSYLSPPSPRGRSIQQNQQAAEGISRKGLETAR